MTKMTDKPVIHWENLYKERWNDLISPSAIQHPAKFSHGLIRRIYEYALEQGYITTDSKVLDPFGGVGLGSFYAVNNGLIWLGNELEDKFYKDAYKNFTLWCERFWCVCDDPEYLNLLRQYAIKPDEESPQLNLFSAQEEVNPDDLLEQIKVHALASWDKPNKGSYCSDCGKLVVAYPVLLKGDSRRLTSVIQEQVSMVVTSPPFVDQIPQQDKTFKMPHDSTGNVKGDYGDSPAQLGNMPAGQFDSVVSSPPYVDCVKQGGEGPGAYGPGNAAFLRTGKYEKGTNNSGATEHYGDTPGQLGAMPPGSYDGLVSSSPFADSIGSDDPDKRGGLYRDDKRRNDKNLTGNYGSSEGQLGTMKDEGFDASIGSPPFVGSGLDDNENKGIRTGKNTQVVRTNRPANIAPGEKARSITYGKSSGQLGAMSEGQLDASISSPSFAGNTGGRGDASRNGIDPALFDRSSGGMKRGTGDSEDNLDHLSMTGFEEAMGGVVSSPPYADIEQSGGTRGLIEHGTGLTQGKRSFDEYGSTNGQLGRENPMTFWAASKEILLQCYQLLKPGAYSFWVVKRFVKAGKVVDFPGQWQQLCEVCGFEHVETIIAWQTEDKGTNYDLDGGKQKKIVKRKSFFRLIFEKKFPELSIDAEVVLVMRKRG